MSNRYARIGVQVVLLALVYGIVWALINAGVIDDYIQATMATICINIILAVSLNLITGFTGQFSLGHAGFMAIGAYTTALVTMEYPTTWGFLGGVFLGAILAAIVGFLIGLPTLRLRGDYLAIATLGMAEIIRILLLNFDFTNGAAGLSGIPSFVGWTWLFVFTVGTIVLSVGINATRAKTLAFTVGAFFGAIAGGLYASYFYFIKPDLFGFLKSIDILVIVVLGGLGSLTGSIIAAILLALLQTFLQPFPELRMIIYSLALVMIMIFRPQGLMGSRELNLASLTRLTRRGRAAEGAS